jgi:DNA-binding XRE family transcriptional regulator
MDTAADRKLFLGGRLKRLRRDLALTQTAMAGDLGDTPCYLDHIERNQRPVSAQLLLRLGNTYLALVCVCAPWLHAHSSHLPPPPTPL